MTEHHDQPRNPLSDALSAAEHSPAARAYEVPVELVRTRARRRRAGRTTAAPVRSRSSSRASRSPCRASRTGTAAG